MTEEQFNKIIKEALDYLANDCLINSNMYIKSGDGFEICVLNAIKHAIKTLSLDILIDYTPGGHGFPDIVLIGKSGNKYGIEVKSSSSNGKSWRINGNSVLGSTKTHGILKTVIIFGKVRGEDSVFRAKD